jgi:hypothetical protein
MHASCQTARWQLAQFFLFGQFCSTPMFVRTGATTTPTFHLAFLLRGRYKHGKLGKILSKQLRTPVSRARSRVYRHAAPCKASNTSTRSFPGSQPLMHRSSVSCLRMLAAALEHSHPIQSTWTAALRTCSAAENGARPVHIYSAPSNHATSRTSGYFIARVACVYSAAQPVDRQASIVTLGAHAHHHPHHATGLVT